MARKRIPTVLAMKSWDDVDAAMLEIIACNQRIECTQLKLQTDIELKKAQAAAKVAQDVERCKLLEKDIKAFAEANRDSLDKKKTWQLLHGKLGFRKSSKCVIPKGKENDIVAALELLELHDCVNTTKKVNKDILRKQADDVITEVGARLDSKEVFWYETASTEIVSNP